MFICFCCYFLQHSASFGGQRWNFTTPWPVKSWSERRSQSCGQRQYFRSRRRGWERENRGAALSYWVLDFKLEFFDFLPGKLLILRQKNLFYLIVINMSDFLCILYVTLISLTAFASVTDWRMWNADDKVVESHKIKTRVGSRPRDRAQTDQE